MSEKNINAIDIERATGIKRNTVYSIISGSSKNPTASNLQLIAKALDTSLEKILASDVEKSDFLNAEELKVIEDATSAVVKAIIKENLNYSWNTLNNLIKEVYTYSTRIEPYHVDPRFVEWLVDKHKG